MAELTMTHRGVVYPWQCDHMGHMNVMYYIGKFDEATWHFLATMGITPTYMRENGRSMVAVEQHLTYKKELHAGDLITIYSGLLEIKGKVVRFFHQMRIEETGELAATAVNTGVQIDRQTRKSCPLPSEIVERARAFVVENIPEE